MPLHLCIDTLIISCAMHQVHVLRLNKWGKYSMNTLQFRDLVWVWGLRVEGGLT